MTYAEAIRQYGIDKPDMRIPPMVPFELAGTEFSTEVQFVAFHLPKVGKLSRREKDELKAFGQERKLMVYDENAKTAAIYEEARRLTGAGPDDLVVVLHRAAPLTGHRPVDEYYQACGQVRLFAGQKYNDRHKLLDARVFKFLWVVDFPMFEWDEEEQRWMAAHHPFTSVHDEDIGKLTSDPARCRAKSYDLVLNGTELGSGSIRIHRRDVQGAVFSALGLSDEEARKKFGFLLDALEYGAPPHGGIALGLDRLVMIMAGETSIREVIPFPKTARGTDLMCDAPSEAPERALRDLGIQLRRS
jgi:aspartyl-tRNA synthetase